MTIGQLFLLWLILLVIACLYTIGLLVLLIIDCVKNYKKKEGNKNGKQRTNNRSRL